MLQEADGDDAVKLHDIPEANGNTSKRRTQADDVDDALFVSSDDEESFQTQRERRASKRRRPERVEATAEEASEQAGGEQTSVDVDGEGGEDDKKKLGLRTSYDGFSIYGRILCLLVKRKGGKTQAATTNTTGEMPGSGSQMMEQWVSTQAVQEGGLEDDEDDG